MSALSKIVKGFLSKDPLTSAVLGLDKDKEEVEVDDAAIGGAATEEDLLAQKRKRGRTKQRAALPGRRGREFGTILGEGRKFGG